MGNRSLEDVLRSEANPVNMLRNSQIGAYVYPVVTPEFTNWRDEQRAWRETAALFDQSHHMAEPMVQGPDAANLLSYLAINSFADFAVDKAKHFVPCSHDGHVIGDVICFRLAEDRFNLVGRVPTVNWVQFHAETGDHDVTIERDDRSPPRGTPVVRRHYRFQIQGPNAPHIFEKLNDGPVPDIKFFNMGAISISGRQVPAFRHGMSGVAGLEIWGPYEEYNEIRGAIIEAGKDFGLYQVDGAAVTPEPDEAANRWSCGRGRVFRRSGSRGTFGALGSPFSCAPGLGTSSLYRSPERRPHLAETVEKIF